MKELAPLYKRLRAAGIPLRTAQVPGYGEIDVPRWLTRVDYDRKGMAMQARNGRRYQRWRRMHGWFVRYRVREGRPMKSFSDGRRGDALRSMFAAAEYLLGIYEGLPVLLFKREVKRKRMSLGHAGIRLVTRSHKDRHVKEWYIEACAFPALGVNQRRFYIGTDNTATAERADATLARALAYRREMEARYKENKRHESRRLAHDTRARGKNV